MMPLPKIEILEGKRFRDQLGYLVKDVGLCERLAQCGDFDEWEVSAASYGNVGNELMGRQGHYSEN